MILFIVFAVMFFRLASKFEKNRLLWTSVGVLSFLIVVFCSGIMIGILNELGILSEIENKYVGYIGAFLGSIIVYFIHRYLKIKWEREDTRFHMHRMDEINNIGNNQD